MEIVHICPHCGKAVDSVGEHLLAERKEKKKYANNFFNEFQKKSWVLRNLQSMLLSFAAFYLLIVLYMLRFDDLETGMRSVFAAIPLLGLIALLKTVHERRILREFRLRHPAEYDNLSLN